MKRRRGLYRFTSSDLRDYARTHLLAGDGSPFLDRENYDALGFTPAFDSLPTREEYFKADRSERYALRRWDIAGPEIRLPSIH